MAETPVIQVENNFVNGLVTEATGLNFPQSAVTETFDCEFNIDGSVERRTGFDFEGNAATKTIDRTNSVVNSYLWQNVAGDGNTNVVVVQVGSTLYFYLGDTSGNYTAGAVTSTVTLTPVAGAPTTNTVEAQFCDGNGFLFVTHPYCQPMRVAFDTATNTASSTDIDLKIRDFEGATADPYTPVDNRPTTTLGTMDHNHLYNLYNQGWNTTNLTAWDTAQTTMPSNADVMWRFVDTSNNFSATSAIIASVVAGNTPAPRGHFILSLVNQDRNTAAGTTGVAATTTGFQRPSTCAFFAGRVFYAGINSAGFNSNIYFSQIVENVNQYGYCYQENDPTSADAFDELPSDGGVIVIPEAGTIYKLFTVPGGLCVFAANGVWFITGSSGIGFTAVDYSIQKIANYATLSATSFVNVGGYPVWWNAENIYQMSASSQMYTTQGNAPVIQPLTYTTIKTFFDAIPINSKRNARGIYQIVDGTIRWIYRSAGTTDINRLYEFDRVLNYNIFTKAFFPWTISPSHNIFVNSIVSSGVISRPVTTDIVVTSGGVTVVTSGGDTVITFKETGTADQNKDKYIVSYPNAGSYKFTFGERNDTKLVDWFSYDSLGVDYNSYFISGFKLRGNAIRKYQNQWVRIFSRLDDDVRYNFQAIWDFANTGLGTGRWSVNQQITHIADKYSNASKRLKVRGHGLAMQFKVSSVTNNNFDLIGWSTAQTVENAP